MRRDQDRRSAEACSNNERQQAQHEQERRDLDKRRAEEDRRQRKAEDLAAESTRRATAAAVQTLGALSAQVQANQQAEQARWQQAAASLRASREAFERGRSAIESQTKQLVDSLSSIDQSEARGTGRRRAITAHATSIGRVHEALVLPIRVHAAEKLPQQVGPQEVGYTELAKPPIRCAMATDSYKKLSDMQDYAESAIAFAADSNSYRSERLDYAHLSQGVLYEADACFASGHELTGDGLIAGARALADGVFTFENLGRAVGAASTFVGGMVDQLIELRGTPLSAYSEFYHTGRFFGGSLKVYLDVAAAASLTQIAAGLGSSTLALSSGAVLAPATAVVATVAGLGATIMAIEAVVDGSKLMSSPKEATSQSESSRTSWSEQSATSTPKEMTHVKGTRLALETAPELSEKLAETFRSDHYVALETLEEVKVYRAETHEEPVGQFFTSKPGLSDIRVRVDSAVREHWPDGTKSPIDTVFEFSIPKGRIIYVGEARPQGGIHVGGTQQIAIPRKTLLKGCTVTNKWPIKSWGIR